MFSFFSKTSRLRPLVLFCSVSIAGCLLNPTVNTDDDYQVNKSATDPDLRVSGSSLGRDANTEDPNFDCEDEARIVMESAELRDSIDGKVVRKLKPGDAVFVCGFSEEWFVYGYVDVGLSINCSKIPDLKNGCLIGWSEFEIELMIAG